ncbi:MAG: hypothetical protein WCF84_17595 [Anaerolineae bacterium]
MMGKVFILVLAGLVLILPGCAAPSPTPLAQPTLAPTLQHGFKGWELYSWQANNEWRFVLLPGTNRLKTTSEIQGAANVVIGVEGIKAELSRLPRGEEIFWGMPTSADALPPAEIVDQIQQFCAGAGLKLTVTEAN